jgi:hypothetical protein
MSGGNERFNAEAAAWDSNPDTRLASDGALQAILAVHPELIETKTRGTTSQEGTVTTCLAAAACPSFEVSLSMCCGLTRARLYEACKSRIPVSRT